ncbi:MAG TPA: helix-turn-helix domain-containing protein [Egibacteraceae bacterium]|nr:helix-turn-helix domain-containing protein [Egibacteraceae bacterium]
MTPDATRGQDVGGLFRHDPEAARQVARRVLATIDELLPRMTTAYREEIPEYGALDAGVVEAEVAPVSREVVEEFFSAILTEGEPDPTVPVDFRAAGRRRLEIGVPLDSALHAFRIAGRVVWNAVVEATQPGEEHVLARLAGDWIDYVDRISSAFAEAYLSASHEQLRRADARRRAVLDAVLAAGDAAELAAVASRWSVTLARAYVPMLVEDDHSSGLIDRLLDAAPPHTLAGTRGHRLLALVPAPGADIPALARAVGARLAARGEAAPPGPVLATEVARAETLLEAAAAAGRHGGVLAPDDLLLEQLVTDSPRLAEVLRHKVMDVFRERGDEHLLGTLRRYLACGSVPETAREDCVHVNTVAYRLKRVRELTGLDPRVPAEAAQLVLGLTAMDVAEFAERADGEAGHGGDR